MNERGDNLEKLRASIEAGRERFDKDGHLDLTYVYDIVNPVLNVVLQDLSTQIEAPHMLAVSESEYVIHYTSIPALVSMLQNAGYGEEQSSLRLYDSSHFNDPDEGMFFDRNLILLNGHKILEVESAPHAYIASFIIPHREKDMTDNLVFWRTYEKKEWGAL